MNFLCVYFIPHPDWFRQSGTHRSTHLLSSMDTKMNMTWFLPLRTCRLGREMGIDIISWCKRHSYRDIYKLLMKHRWNSFLMVGTISYVSVYPHKYKGCARGVLCVLNTQKYLMSGYKWVSEPLQKWQMIPKDVKTYKSLTFYTFINRQVQIPADTDADTGSYLD